jgi:hypothetical protein
MSQHVIDQGSDFELFSFIRYASRTVDERLGFQILKFGLILKC